MGTHNQASRKHPLNASLSLLVRSRMKLSTRTPGSCFMRMYTTYPPGTPASQSCISCFQARRAGVEVHFAAVRDVSASISFVARVVREAVACLARTASGSVCVAGEGILLGLSVCIWMRRERAGEGILESDFHDCFFRWGVRFWSRGSFCSGFICTLSFSFIAVASCCRFGLI